MVHGRFPVSCPLCICEFPSLHPRCNYTHLISLPWCRSAGCLCSKGNWVVLSYLKCNHVLLDSFPNPLPLVIPVLQGSKKEQILLSSEPVFNPLDPLFSLYNCFGTVIYQVHFRSQSKHWLRQECKYLLRTLGSQRTRFGINSSSWISPLVLYIKVKKHRAHFMCQICWLCFSLPCVLPHFAVTQHHLPCLALIYFPVSCVHYTSISGLLWITDRWIMIYNDFLQFFRHPWC